jgi:hypothetical protein
MIDAPKRLRGGGVCLAAPGRGGRRELAWDPVDGARGYRLELRTKGQSEVLKRLEAAEARTSGSFGVLAPGEDEASVLR